MNYKIIDTLENWNLEQYEKEFLNNIPEEYIKAYKTFGCDE